MKTITVEKNRAFLYYELSDKSCHDILDSQDLLRFDLTYKDDDINLKTWRAVIKHDDETNLAILELRDYDSNHRDVFSLAPMDSVTDVAAFALRQVWDYIEDNSDSFPPTQPFPKINVPSTLKQPELLEVPG